MHSQYLPEILNFLPNMFSLKKPHFFLFPRLAYSFILCFICSVFPILSSLSLPLSLRYSLAPSLKTGVQWSHLSLMQLPRAHPG